MCEINLSRSKHTIAYYENLKTEQFIYSHGKITPLTEAQVSAIQNMLEDMEQEKTQSEHPESFIKVNETDYLIFGLPYKANQILEISPSGQQTLDGNKEFYFQKQYQFDQKNNDNGYIAEEFKNFQKINKDITKCLLVPVKYEGLYAKTTDMVLPKAYDFSDPKNSCDVLCLPFFGNTAANSGVFAYYRDSVRGFASHAGWSTVSNADLATYFQQALFALFKRVKTK